MASSDYELAPPTVSRRFLSKKRAALLALASLSLGLLLAYSQKDRYTDHLAEFSRSLIGDENTARLESWYFAAQDRIDQLKYDIFGGEADPFEDNDDAVALPPVGGVKIESLAVPTTTPQPTPTPGPPPLLLPPTQLLSADPEPGEGDWTTAGLPRSSPEDVLMAKTFLRPDRERPYAAVGVLLVDHRRVRLHITGGVTDPGGDLGVAGPGLIPDEERKDLLVAWNGGFRGPHGGFGMYADGRQYRPLRNGFASIALYRDGRVAIGEWGRDLTWSDDIEAVRQNAILLVDGCEVSPRTGEGNDTWGYVQVDSSEFITWRSAVGLTANGDLLIAAGNSLSADSLARALHAAGACSAMQLDINSPYVLTSLFFPEPDGSIEAARFMATMPDNPSRFLSRQDHDFMYLTLDESAYRP